MKLDHEIEAIKQRLLGSLLVNPSNPQTAIAALQAAMAGALDALVAQGKMGEKYSVNVVQNPVDPTQLDIGVRFQPPFRVGSKHCWDCGWNGFPGRTVDGPNFVAENVNEFDNCGHCHGHNLHDRARNALDAMGEATDGGLEEG
jgi:hypothetical protein